MTARYSSWHGTTLRGDRELAASYLAEGRKWLGTVAEQLTRSGNYQSQIRHTNADGVTFTARIVGGVPTLIIDARREDVREPESTALHGFVLTPAGTDEGAYLETVLGRPRQTEGTWRAVFLDATHRPADYGGPGLFYGTVHGKPFLAAPPGLQYSGNTDWRNADETVHVSWAGVSTRYFSTSADNGRGRYVYFKGARLFDIGALPASDPAPPHILSDATVAGACLRKANGGWWLLVVLRTIDDLHDNHDWPGPGTRYDTVLAVPVRRPLDAPPLPAGGRFAESPRLECDYAAVRYLGEHEIQVDTYDYGHPWLFNQSGTEARCIRPEFYTTVRECIFSLVADGDDELSAAAYSEVTEPWRTVTETTVSTRTYAPLRFTGTTNSLSAASGTSATLVDTAKELSFTPGEDGPTLTTDDYKRDWLIAEDTTITTASDGRVKCAVDFVADVPVYAYWLPPDHVRHKTFALTPAMTMAATVGDADTHAGTYYPDVLTLWSLRYSGDLVESATWSRSDTTNGHLGGLEFPWGRDVRTIANATTDAGTLSHHWAWDWSDTTPFTDTLADDPAETPWDAHGPGGIINGWYDATLTVDRTEQALVSKTGYDLTFYADLRVGWHVQIAHDESSTTTVASVGTRTYAENPGDRAPSGPYLTITGFGSYAGGTGLAWSTGDGNPSVEFGTGIGTKLILPDAVTTSGGSHDARIYRIKLRGIVLREQVLAVTDVAGSPIVGDFEFNDGIGNVLHFPLSRASETLYHSARTRDDFHTLDNTDTTDISDGGSDSDTADFMYQGYANPGSWQTFRGRYCYACPAAESESTPVAYLQGLGNATTGLADPAGEPGPLIGYPAEDTLWPISILPPTKPF